MSAIRSLSGEDRTWRRQPKSVENDPISGYCEVQRLITWKRTLKTWSRWDPSGRGGLDMSQGPPAVSFTRSNARQIRCLAIAMGLP